MQPLCELHNVLKVNSVKCCWSCCKSELFSQTFISVFSFFYVKITYISLASIFILYATREMTDAGRHLFNCDSTYRRNGTSHPSDSLRQTETVRYTPLPPSPACGPRRTTWGGRGETETPYLGIRELQSVHQTNTWGWINMWVYDTSTRWTHGAGLTCGYMIHPPDGHMGLD